MLIVLLDCSSSMNEPPQGDGPPAEADVRKIDRACQVLNEHLARAHPQERVIVLGFAGRAVELARGHSIHDLDLQSRIGAAQLGSGTDIPAALAAAAAAIRSEPADGPCTVIVITDGLLDGRPDEDLDSAVAELSPLVAYLKVSLIGASERGLKIAIRISPNAPIALHPAMKSPAHDGWPAQQGGPPAFSGSPHLRSAPVLGMPTVVADMAPPVSEEPEGIAALAAAAVDLCSEEPEGMAALAADVFSDEDVMSAGDEIMAGMAEVVVSARACAPERLSHPEGMAGMAAGVVPPVPKKRDGGTPQSVVIAQRLETLETMVYCRGPSLGHARDVEDVAVTVAHAPGVARGVWHPLDVFVHLASLEDEVARIVRAERGHGAARASRSARLRRGATVRIEPRIEGAELDVEALEMRWRDDVQRAVFRIRPAAGATALRGSVDVYVKHAILCTVPIAIAVVDAPRPAEPAVTTTGRMMDVVFVSYATEERRIVERVTRTYRELGIAVLIDHAFLHAGDMTGEVLRRQIERADVFQLFWSTRSSQKPWVEREWRHALTLTGPAGRKGARFIRPLVWERRPPAWPPELAALQFSRLELAWLARASAHPGIFAAMCLAAATGFAAVVAIVFALAAVR